MTLHRLHAFGAGAIAAAVVAGLLILFWPARHIAPERHLRPAEHLPDAARAALRTQMRAHARGAIELVSTVTILDYDGVGMAVTRLLEEPRVARPTTHDATELNAALPARFFDLQDELREHLQAIRLAAAARQPDALADAFGAATRTCVRCHDAYLTGR